MSSTPNKSIVNFSSSALVVAISAFAAFSSGCSERLSPLTSPCPCATGYVCCESGICATSETSCEDATLALARESAGTWTGYLENFALRSGGDEVSISLSVSGQNVSGQVVFGTAQQPPAPQPNMPWPPGSSDDTVFGEAGIVEGFVYQAREVRWLNRRLKFQIELAEAWQPFCDAVATPPITLAEQTFVCPTQGVGITGSGECRVHLEPWTFSDTIQGVPVSDADCAVLKKRCGPGQRCICDEVGCSALPGQLSVDVALRGDMGDGSMAGPSTGLDDPLPTTNLRLTRSTD